MTERTSLENYNHYRSHVQEIFGEPGGFLVPTGPGKRIIILHIGNENGFLDASLDCFLGKTGCNDYHHEINAEHFVALFEDLLSYDA